MIVALREGGIEMTKVRIALIAVTVGLLQAGPVIAQCGIPGGCPAVPSPEIGAGVLGLLAATGMVRLIRSRLRR